MANYVYDNQEQEYRIDVSKGLSPSAALRMAWCLQQDCNKWWLLWHNPNWHKLPQYALRDDRVMSKIKIDYSRVRLGTAYMQQQLNEKYRRGVFWYLSRTLKAECNDVSLVIQYD